MLRPPALLVNENRGSDSMQIGEIDRHFYIFADQAVGNRIHRHISEYRDLFEKYRDSHLVPSGKRWKAHSPSSGELCPDMIYIHCQIPADRRSFDDSSSTIASRHYMERKD